MAWLGQNWVGLEICALVTGRVVGGGWSPGQHAQTHTCFIRALSHCIPLTEPGNKTIPSRSRVSQEAKRI